MQQDSFFVKHSRAITIISIAGIIFCIVLIIITVLHNYLSRKTYLTVQFAPATAHLELYSQNLSLTNGTYELTPGTYTGVLTADGFKPKDITITVNPRQVNTYTDYLVNLSKGLAYFERSTSDLATLRSITDDSDITAFLEAYDYKASLHQLLPFTVSWRKYPNDTPMDTVTISNANNHPDCTGTLCLLITGPTDNRTEIAKALAERGYDINNYEVIYEYNALY